MKAPPLAFSPGFTLVEALVALTILGFVVVLLGGSFQFGARTWEVASEEVDGVGEVEAAQGFLRRQLAQALPLTLRGAAAKSEPVFAGESDALRFSAPLSIPYSDGGLYVFALGTAATGSAKDLTVQWQVYRPDWSQQEVPLGEPEAVLTGIADLRFTYYGRVEDDTDAIWQSEWIGKGLPTLIRIDVAFPDGDHRLWPGFVVALKASSGRQR